MFIKNIVIGVLGLLLFPLIEIVSTVTGFEAQSGMVFMSGVTVSLSMIAYYFVNVYVIGKRRSILTLTSSWVLILSVFFPLTYFTYFSNLYFGEISLRSIMLYITLSSIFVSWLMVFVELFRSGTFKAY